MLPGVLYADGLRGRSGFPTPAKGSLVRFRRAPRYLSVRRPPPARTGGFILPRACRLLQSSTACDLPRGPTTSRWADLRSASLGVPLPHRGTSKRRPPMRGIPDPALRSVLGVSHALDGLLRHLPCGFVSPRSHVQGLPSRGLSLARSRTGFPRPVHALLALDAKSLRCDPRQPFAPSTSGLSLPAASAVASGTCLGFHPLRAPPGLCLLRVFLPRTAETISRFLHPRPSFGASPPRLALGVCTARGAVDLCPGYRPARGF
jgi:hypothetical protein